MKNGVLSVMSAVTLALAVTVAAPGQSAPTSAPASAPASSAASRPAAATIVEGGNQFGLELYGRLADQTKGNLFICPASVHAMLAMAMAGASGKTAEQMADALRVSLKGDKLAAAFGKHLKQLTTPGDVAVKGRPAYELSLFNSAWVQTGLTLAPEFLKMTQAEFSASVNDVSFADPVYASMAVNGWISGKTKKKIEWIMPSDAINPASTKLVLVNAAYFQASWLLTFLKNQSGQSEFSTGVGAPANVPMMNGQEARKYAENDSLQAVELPFEAEGLTMLILLPRTVEGLGDMEKQLSQGKLDGLLKGMAARRVTISLPKFNFTSELKLSKALTAMGMADAFNPQAADFSGMAAGQKLAIGELVHKATIGVNEDGSDTNSSSSVGFFEGRLGATGNPRTFIADHPFVFIIRHKATGAILFMGRVADPKSEK